MATSTTQLLTRFSFPKQPGDQPWSIIDVTGPTYYQPVDPPGPPGTPPSGGQLLFAQDFGLQALEMVWAMGSSDGRYFGTVIPIGGVWQPEPHPLEFTGGDDFIVCVLVWAHVGGGQAAGDLSHTRMRLMAIGR